MKYQIEDVVQNGEIIEDDMTNIRVQLQDSIFVVKDVVMKVSGRGDFHDPLKIGMYCILYGEKTGSFARKVQYSSYNIIIQQLPMVNTIAEPHNLAICHLRQNEDGVVIYPLCLLILYKRQQIILLIQSQRE